MFLISLDFCSELAAKVLWVTQVQFSQKKLSKSLVALGRKSSKNCFSDPKKLPHYVWNSVIWIGYCTALKVS